MYKLTIKNAGQYSGIEAVFETMTETTVSLEQIEAAMYPAKLEFYIEFVDAEGEDQ